MNKKILILGIDSFEAKNISQIKTMNAKGYIYSVFTNDLRGDSNKNFREIMHDNEIIIAEKSFIKRVLQFAELLEFKLFHHVELYAAGRMTYYYLLICKIYGFKMIVVERGDIGHLHNHKILNRIVIGLAYKVADLVWYKEPYMKKLILDYTNSNKLYFLPNAAPGVNKLRPFKLEIEFLWVNRFTKERCADWLVKCLNDRCFEATESVILGLQKVAHPYILELQELVIENNFNDKTKIEYFADPIDFYKRARFFVLPAEAVFGNNSLLEAMSMGVVPIVSETESTELIVKDGENGLVFEHTEEGLMKALKRAKAMVDTEWKILSENAKTTIEEQYSQEKWGDTCHEMYKKIQS